MNKVLGILLITFLFVFGINNVNAETITLEQVADKTEEILKKSNNGEDTINVLIEEKNMIIKVEDLSIVFDYENGILSFKHSTGNDIESFLGEVLIYAGSASAVTQAVAELHGYNERDTRLFLDFENSTFEENGYEYKTINNDTEMQFKIDINNFSLNLEYIDGPTPKLSIAEVTSTNISLSVDADVDDGTMVEIYRSKDGINYEWIGSSAVYSYVTSSFAFETLEPNTTYYYKAAIEKSKNFSEVLKVTTLSEIEDANSSNNDNTNNNSTNDEIDNSKDSDTTTDNPKTGMFNPIVVCSILTISGILLISVINKKNIIKKI